MPTTKTIVIQIGNSDDKLSQAEWAQFVEAVAYAVNAYALEVHFNGFSPPQEKWQNAAWVAVCDEAATLELGRELKRTRAHFRQDSVAFTIGDTKMI